MLCYRSAFANFLAYVAVISFVLLTSALVGAQTPSASADKLALAASPLKFESGLNTSKASTASPREEPTKATADSTKSETEAVKANTTPPTRPPTLSTPPPPPVQCTANNTVNADVVAMPKAIMLNRMGASIPNAFVFALKSDTVGSGGNIQLRPGKRARPIVLRANVGDCLRITFTNAIPQDAFSASTPQNVPVGTKEVSLHIQGMEWTAGSQDDGSFVGKNSSSLASAAPGPSPNPSPMPPQQQTYTLFVKNEGTFLLYTMGDTTAEPVGQLSRGLFGALNVEPTGGEWYRSQVTAEDLSLATYTASKPPAPLTCPSPGNICTFTLNGQTTKVIKTATGQLNTLDNHPLINYDAPYPDGTPILNMQKVKKDPTTGKILRRDLVHTDLTAIITGPNAGRFPGTTGVNNPEPACNAEGSASLNPPPGGKVDPLFCKNPAAPDRKQPYREVTILYHEVGQVASQAFPVFTDENMQSTLNAGFDGFAINYGTGGIGAEVYANRIGVGPMGECVDCKFEEFFLSAWSVGDPAMLVDKPANSGLQPPCTTTAAFDTPACGGTKSSATFPYTMTPKVKATVALFPDDPSNVYHSYINDHIKFRILHGGTIATHVHHQHAHQWLQSPNSDEGSYLDSQMISPGASYTLEMTYNGSGNRNKVVGDSIFHCHFYPHFAAGMWAMWRTHDVFEAGTFVFPKTSAKAGQVVPGSRALPDGEIVGGAPTPALVPMPTIPMAPLPAYAQIQTGVAVNGVPTTLGGQVVVGGKCLGNKINGLDVIGGCSSLPPGAILNGKAINVQFNGTTLTGQFQLSAGNGNTIENPGYPYFIPGIAGARAPHPPFDFAPDGAGGFLDGGLPRHVVSGGSVSYEKHDQFDWSKDLATMNAVQLPEDGTPVEKAAISFFHNRCYATFFPNGTPGSCPPPLVIAPEITQNTPPTGFVLNGLPLGPQPGAPFADPAVDDNGNAINVDPVTHHQRTRRYKAAAIQMDVQLNKKGWHFPQQRMLTLWNDVAPTIATTRKPEPLFFRGNSGDIVEYWHTNLVPNYYLVDDFQVRTPTDILGQHIHLVKFDVTSSDGAGNGFNYEDGTFSPEEVQEITNALKKPGGSWTPCPGCAASPLNPKAPPPEICSVLPSPPQCAHEWKGAQTTVQRWYLDPLVDNSNVDRTLRTVFTHDHFGPSTHQQAGLYAGLVVEPKNSNWRNSEDGTPMGGGPVGTPPVRPDGGPTNWKADILTKDKDNKDISYREFVLEFQDLQLAYTAGSRGTPSPDKDKGWRDAAFAINPTVFPEFGQVRPRLVSTGNDTPITGTQSVNYYNEPIGFRIGRPVPDGGNDMSYAYDNLAALKVDPVSNPDPGTPLMRAYQNDNVQVRVLVGAHVFAHQFNLEGPTWFAEPSWENSGYRSNQPMGLSEHFELLFKVPSSSAPIPVAPATTVRKCPDGMSEANCVDYLYSPSLDETGIAQGLWGIFRSYDPTAVAKQLQPLTNNPIGPGTNVTYATCPGPANRTFKITAVSAEKALPASRQPLAPKQLVLNDRGDPANFISTLLGVMYVRSDDLDSSGVLKPGVPIEPLILRANAGDCIDVELTNAIDPSSVVLGHNFRWAPPFNQTVPGSGAPVFNSRMSGYVGLHPQLLSYDAASSYGLNVGWNSKGRADQFANFGETVKYKWYAGKIDRASDGSQTYIPVEFGSLNLFPSDPLFNHPNGLFGSMVIEPAGSKWTCGEAMASPRDCDPPSSGPSAVPPTTRASATVTKADGTKFREFVVMISDALVTSSTSSAINYRSEPKSFRYPNVTGANDASSDFSCMTSNLLVGPTPPTPVGDPKTPIFTAALGDQVRFRMTHPFGTGDSQVFTVHGHNWQRNPYSNKSKEIGNNPLSQWLGSRDNHGSTDHFDLVIDKAGGTFRRPGDYLYTAYLPDQSLLGAWGIFRVIDPHTGLVPAPAPNGVCKQTQPPPVPTTAAPAAPTEPEKDLHKRFRRQPVNPPAKP